MSKPTQRILILAVFVILNILNAVPGPMNWNSPLVFGFFPPQLFWWTVFEILAVLTVALIVSRPDLFLPWTAPDQVEALVGKGESGRDQV